MRDVAPALARAPRALALLAEYALLHSGGGDSSSEAPDPDLYHTLLRLYLDPPPPTVGSADDGPPLAPRPDDALALLARGWPPGRPPAYDPDVALVLARASASVDARPLLFLLERRRLFREVVAVHAASRDASALVAAAVAHGDPSTGGDAGLLSTALDALAGMDAAAVRPALPPLLTALTTTRALPPLVVIDALSRVPGLTLGDVRPFVAAALADDGGRAAADGADAARLRSEAARLRVDAATARARPRVFQASRCAATGAPLDLPAVHFFCGHSFNAAALAAAAATGEGGGGDDAAAPTPSPRAECPLCAPAHRTVAAARAAATARAGEQDAFFSSLKGAADGFDVVADWVGRGLLSVREGG